MDDIVKQALAKWPNVPNCWGWLGLDMRGNWWLRDTDTQAAGDFAHSKGCLLEHTKLLAFIERNYEADAQGYWFFQNGPQRVYVELEATPLVWRIDAHGAVASHLGTAVSAITQCVMDEQGRLYLQADGVLGIVHSQDMLYASEQIEAGRWQVQEMSAAQLPHAFGFVRSPQSSAPAR
jgi:hypothetical protein